jgi:anti-sigma regulatory factor (Ser/Thr protein kinase)
VTTQSDGTAAATIQLAPDPGAPGRAREFLTRFVRAEGAERYAEDGRVVVSELVTNAVRYSRTEMAVDLELTGAGLEVGVYDDGPGQPRITPATRRELGGRGLVLVARLAHEWGVQFAERGGKRVWCMLTDRVRGEADESGDDVMPASAKQSSPRPIRSLGADRMARGSTPLLTSVVLAVGAVVPRRRRGPPRAADNR